MKYGLYLFPLLLSVLCCASCQTHRAGRQVPPGTIVKIITHADENIQFTRRVRNRETARFLKLINQYRKKKKLGRLSLDPKLQKAAQWMSEEMGTKNYLGHKDSRGRDPFQRSKDFGYAYNTYKAENVAAGHKTAAEAFQAWKISPRHRKNMLGKHFNTIGIGFAYSKKSKYGWYWTTTFGGEKSK